MKTLLGRVAAFVVARPGAVIAAATFATLIGIIAAARLTPDARTDTLVDRGSETFAATERFREGFGDDAVVVLVRGDLRKVLLGEDLGRLLAFESCLSGRASGEQALDGGAAPEVCAEIAELNASQVVLGPATFLREAAARAIELLGEESQAAFAAAQETARQAAAGAAEEGLPRSEQRAVAEATASRILAGFRQELIELAVEIGLSGPPSLDDPAFVSSIVFDSRRKPGVPKARFAYLFPNRRSALIGVRLRSDLESTERQRAIELVREAVSDPRFRLRNGSYVVSGVPVVVEGLADALQGEIFVLLAIALAVMAVALITVFGPPLRLLPLAVAIVAGALVFGGLSLFGGSLTLASLAVLPVMIGLAVDYAIQLQARFREAAEQGAGPAGAAVAAASRGGPVIGTAALATGAGFLVLLLSPIPIVRGFGLLLVAAIAIALAVALTAGLATLSVAGRKPGRGGGAGDAPVPRSRQRLRRWQRTAAIADRPLATVRRAGAAIGRAVRAVGRASLAAAISKPLRVLAVAAVLAACGWVAGARTEVESDIRELVPADLEALRGLDELQQRTGVSGELDVIVRGEGVDAPETIEWMREFEQRVLERHGFAGRQPRCGDEGIGLCPGPGLPDLFPGERTPTAVEVRSVLRAIPDYYAQAVITGEGADRIANIAFLIPVMPLDEQKELIDDVRSQVSADGAEPPAGVDVDVVGLPALAADANSVLEGSRWWLTGAGLLAVALVLVAVYRSAYRALVPLIPIVLASGWSALILAAMDVPLNPMSVTLGALVIAIATEFSVILSARYHEERGGGRTVGEALRWTYSRTGTAVVASGVTALAGFAVLTASGIRMLSDFGLVVVVDLGVAVVGVLLVLPAALVWAESRFEGARGVGQRGGGRLASLRPARLARRSGGAR